MSAAIYHPFAERDWRGALLEETRSWIDTPFVHRASIKDAGADCVGLIRGVWRSALGKEPFAIPAYTTDWRLATGEDTLLETMRDHFVEVPIGRAQAGDILLFRIKAGAPTRHCGILSETNTLIHAYYTRGVIETHLVPWWTRRIAAAFAFPAPEQHT